MTTSKEVFTRKASGLTRVMSPYSAFAYNVLAIGILFPWAYLWASAVFPAAHVPIGILLTGILMVPMWFAYSWLSASMPRSGGDYVFQTRIISGPVGFAVTVMGASFVMYIPFAGWMLTATGLAPMIAALEFNAGRPGLSSLLPTLAGSWGTIAVSVVCLLIALWILIRGFRNYVIVQWILWYGLLASLAAILFVTIAVPHEQFVANFNAFYAWAAPDVQAPSGFYQYVIDAAVADGANLAPKVDWLQTLGVSTIAANSLVWAVLAVQQLGEIKGANVVKNTNFFIVGSGIFSAVLMAAIAFFLFKVAGNDFMLAVAHSYWTGNIAFPVEPWIGTLASIAALTSPLAAILICVGIVLNAFQVVCNVIIYSVRIFFAAGLDGLFPAWVSEVHPKYRAPVKLYLAFFLWVLIWVLLYNLWAPFGGASLSVAAAFTLYFAITCMAAALFPYLKKVKGIYDASPITSIKIGRIPWITILGVLGAIFNLIVLVYYLFFPDLGVFNTLSISVIVGIYVFWFIYYYARRAYMRSKAVDVELAFRQIPPD